MAWSDYINWDDTAAWSDTDELAAITSTETTNTTINPLEAGPMTTIIENIGLMRKSSGAITADIELATIIPKGYLLETVVIKETAGNACTVKGGSTSGGAEWWAATACGASAITTITVNKLLDDTNDTSVFLTFTAGSSYSIDIYFFIVNLMQNGG